MAKLGYTYQIDSLSQYEAEAFILINNVFSEEEAKELKKIRKR